MRCIAVLLLTVCAHLVAGDAAWAEPDTATRRRQLQERNKDAVVRLRALLYEHLSQSPATSTPSSWRGPARRRRLAAKPRYSSQCLYEPLPPPDPEPPAAPSSPTPPPGEPPQQPQSSDAPPAASQPDPTAAASRRRRAQEQQDPQDPPPSLPPPDSPSSPPPPPDAPSEPPGEPPAAPPAPPPAGRCYLNPAVIAHPDMPDPESPIEVMLLKSAWTAYQCSFEKRQGRCGTYRHEPYDCRWQDDQSRCAVPSDYLLPRLLTYLHCRDDATISPFWDRCYRVGVVLTGGDNDWCGQSDGNLARCWWFPARDDSESDVCAPSPGGGVESRDAYDELVAQMRNGTWLPDWFGSCPTSELVATVKAACSYTNVDDCAADPTCAANPDLPPEYGMCRMRDELIWEAIFGTDSALFNATAQAMAECAAASDSPESCMAAGSLARGDDGGVLIDADKFGDVVDLVFIEELQQGAAAAARPAAARAVLLAAAAAALLGGLRGSAATWLGGGWL